ncbi:SH3 domain-containing protein [Candidatus Thiothrix sp. Deng01]|uniref:SH3 domain-containing protein n=1 Tax=Candidatus Thiothrix phosphatis TaxID=3112415 RepID=A0ABU6CS34_9GAMM|nr:SH3 domain-containing protein [Candidatus Thiothrix sp. Deng01]MEB4589636.1 SH3 domain-containing protein [Candidatus Thiothrix sp. Deng01]
MLIRTLLVASCLGVALTFSAMTEAAPLMPVDEATKQPDFFTFRAQLQTAIAKRDKAALLAAVNKNIQNTFGDDNGIDNFKKLWKIDQPNSPVWETLGTVLALGGGFQKDHSFQAPYISSHWPNLDGFENVAIIGDKVNVRKAPKQTSEVLQTLSYEVVPLAGPGNGDAQWVAIKLPNGKKGYVSRNYTRSPVDYRAFFAKVDGRWQMTVLVAGD